ncbi:MAG: substrate-binding domain-containing protein [Pleurocapsa sp.]
MIKKSDILPLILALISTMLIVGLGFLWLTKIDITKFGNEKELVEDKTLKTSESKVKVSSQSAASTDAERNFVMPAIVPQGTAVTINGSTKMARINQALRRGFHRQFPGTAITTNADGSKAGMDLLTSGMIDLAAIERPLNQVETAAGLAAVKIDNLTLNGDSNRGQELYYVYREPVEEDVEAFLGYVLSPIGQQAIIDR